MENRIEFYLQFDYKGETHRPAVTVNLDQLLQQQGTLPNLYLLLARENGIGLYSYELEVMESLPIQVAHAEGELVSRFVDGESWDPAGFEKAWHLQQQRGEVETLAAEYLDSVLLQRHPQIIEALLAAYQRGREAS
jgi:hypothetical protein